tara:strand:+ start:1957 stop:3471 length:1515 start_codon:yes stop_codon:yes gene_type:complete
MADNSLKLFGFEIRKSKTQETKDKNLRSIVPKVDEDGAGYVTASGSHYGQYIDIHGDKSKDNSTLIQKYRGVALHPEVDAAIEDITNESVSGGDEIAVKLDLDKTELSKKIKNTMQDEFDSILYMLNFAGLGHDIFRSWYVDGRLCYHLIVDEKNEKKGIQDIRPIDSAKLRKVKEVIKKKDPVTGASIIEGQNEYFIYQEKPGQQNSGIKLTKDSVIYTTSGLLDASQKHVVSYLHKALKPINQLRMMEDSLVIYRLARAPERRIFYIDVGNMPKGKSEEYMKGIMTRYRNKLVYDASTGEIKDDRKHMSMLEDFWLPRREGGKGTEISTLPGGENLGQIDDIVYFQKRLYRSLNVPVGRLEQEATFNLGRSTEISRDELKFQKFIDRLRKRFSMMFREMLKRQLILKGIIAEEDWADLSNQIMFDFVRDNHFTELKEAELLREKLQSLDQVQQYVGDYFSKEWVMKNVLKFDDDQIKQVEDQADKEEPDEPDQKDNRVSDEE